MVTTRNNLKVTPVDGRGSTRPALPRARRNEKRGGAAGGSSRLTRGVQSPAAPPSVRLLTLNGNPDLLGALARDSAVDLWVMGQAQVTGSLASRLEPRRLMAYRPGSKLSVSAIRSVRRAVRDVEPDIIHTFTSRGLAHALMATMAMRRRPKIIGYRGVIRPVSRWDPGHRITLFHARTSAIVCASDAVRVSLTASGITADRCHTIHNPFEIRSVPGQCRDRRGEWNIPSDALVIGTTATMRPVKRIDLLLRAAIECADIPDLYWLLIGPVMDPRVTELANDRRIRDRVRMLGFRRDAPQLIGAADILAMPSDMEGLSRVMLEAMAQRVCPVVTDVGGASEVVRHGVDGLLFPRGDLDALVRHIRYLHAHRNQIRMFGHAAFQRVRTMFAPNRCSQQFIQLYRQLMSV